MVLRVYWKIMIPCDWSTITAHWHWLFSCKSTPWCVLLQNVQPRNTLPLWTEFQARLHPKFYVFAQTTHHLAQAHPSRDLKPARSKSFLKHGISDERRGEEQSAVGQASRPDERPAFCFCCTAELLRTMWPRSLCVREGGSGEPEPTMLCFTLGQPGGCRS